MLTQEIVIKMKNYIIENFIGRESYMLKSYKQRRNDFTKLFKDTNVDTSLLISDYSCAIYAGTPKILQQGRMYITTEFITFYSRLLTFEQKICIPLKDVIEISKEKTAMVFQNAIQIVTYNNEKYFFASFTSRDRTYHVINKLWSEYRDGIKASKAKFWDRVRENYGTDLGYSFEDSELEESGATQFIARYKKSIDVISNSSQEESNYESLEESPVTDHAIQDLNINVNNVNGRKSLSRYSSIEEEIKFDVSLQSFTKESSSESESVPIKENVLPIASCSDHEHLPNILMDEEFNINVTDLWSYLFTDHAFFRAFCAMRLISEITQSNWSDDVEIGKGTCRTLYYTVNLKNRIGPKKSPTVEKQVLLKGSCKNYIYYVESTVRTVGIPMSDSFHVVLRYCILYVNPNKSRIKISMKIAYDKSVFFATKSIIDSSVKSGCVDYHKDLKQALLSESQKNNGHISDQKVYCSQSSIEDSYHAPINDSTEKNSETTISNNIESDTKISWIYMIIICVIAFFILYIMKDSYSDSSKFPEGNNKLRHNHRDFDQDSLTEIMKIIKEMKNTIDILKLNIEMLNQSNNNCS